MAREVRASAETSARPRRARTAPVARSLPRQLGGAAGCDHEHAGVVEVPAKYRSASHEDASAKCTSSRTTIRGSPREIADQRPRLWSTRHRWIALRDRPTNACHPKEQTGQVVEHASTAATSSSSRGTPARARAPPPTGQRGARSERVSAREQPRGPEPGLAARGRACSCRPQPRLAAARTEALRRSPGSTRPRAARARRAAQ